MVSYDPPSQLNAAMLLCPLSRHGCEHRHDPSDPQRRASIPRPLPSESGNLVSLPVPWKKDPSLPEIQSGQALVYRVTRKDDNSLYALKRLKNRQSEDRRSRFERELHRMDALNQAGLRVPAIVAYDASTERPWFVMPWFARGSLQVLIESSGSDYEMPDRLSLFEELCQIIKSVHDAGIAHRDLKPENVLVDDDGSLYLTDFGLSLSMDDERLTSYAEAVGSRYYIAPENESGASEDVDQRPADFYALGKIGWVLLTGRSVRAREQQSEAEWRVSTLLDDNRLASMDTLLSSMISQDVRTRASDWGVLMPELRAARLRFDPSSQMKAKSGEHDDLLSRATEALRRIETSEATREGRREQEIEREMTDRYHMFASAFLSAFTSEVDDFVEELQGMSTQVRFVVGSSGPVVENLLGHPLLARIGAVRSACLRHAAIGGISVHDVSGWRNRSFNVNLYGIVVDGRVRIFRSVFMYEKGMDSELLLPPHFPRLSNTSARLGWPSQDSFISSVVRESAPLTKVLITSYLSTLNEQPDATELQAQLTAALATYADRSP